MGLEKPFIVKLGLKLLQESYNPKILILLYSLFQNCACVQVRGQLYEAGYLFLGSGSCNFTH